jgi:hypothetical protein
VQQTDSQGSSVIYEETFTLPDTLTPGVMMDVSVNQLPLAGGLTPFNVRIYNRGYTPIYFVATRGGGSQPGDLYISVENPQGQEVARTPYTGTPTGVIFDGGVGYVMIPPGSSTTLTVPNVLVPAALASNHVSFQAVIPLNPCRMCHCKSVLLRAATVGMRTSPRIATAIIRCPTM